MKLIKIIITGGGTGGHLFPGIALADKFMSLNSNTRIIFVGSKIGLEKKILKSKGYLYYGIVKNSFRKNILQIPKSLLIAKNILENFSPQIVISTGGYSAAPISLVAKLKKIPLLICEQNILPGLTNRLLIKIADRIYTSFNNTIGFENNKKVMFTGNPIRENIININKLQQTKPRTHGLKQKITILILGGSQGAHAINLAVMSALKHLNGTNNLHFIHQSGSKDEKKVREKYFSRKIIADVRNFFDDISTCYAKADLVISRAGATTIAELMTIGRASILIPYPFATENHQTINAEFLVNAGGSEMISQKELTGFILAQHINKLVDNPEKIARMALMSKAIAKNNATQIITNDIYEILEQRGCI